MGELLPPPLLLLLLRGEQGGGACRGVVLLRVRLPVGRRRWRLWRRR